MDEALQSFEAMLADACAEITGVYFQLPIADADSLYRERVYCYELYHQLRRRWDTFPYSLGGEVDKAGHPHFRRGPYARSKPDLLVHIPGDMDNNLVCVEVKPLTRPVDEFVDDIRKLIWFCENAHYYRGLFLVYGTADDNAMRDNLPGKFHDLFGALEGLDISRIQFWFHPAPWQASRRIEY